ncbi:MAG: ABC transporter ATP-binding protein [Chloroflexota bacterium]|nr:ABC transporter ATP-binding protein [Chloroflexota bacterium]
MLKLDKLTVAYGDHLALNGVTLEVSPGEILAVIGPNGAGKTTLIRAVSGVIPIKSGAVYSDGRDLSKLTPGQRAKLLAVVPQARPLGGMFTVEQTILMGRTAYMGWLGQPDDDDLAITQLAMQRTKMTHLAERRIAELSGGEQQRALLARALAQATPILLLDEPTNHLDLQHQMNILSLVRELAIEQNLAVLMAIHDLNLVSFFADRVALFVNAELRTLGTLEEVLTEENISAAYQTPVQVLPHPNSGVPLILPTGAGRQNER